MAEPRRFVIQQHDATRLHWDLRLEHDGVLRSWALPRGVPWNPKENRLAVATEDHPLEFLDYEGDAVDPGYGSGRMTNWDTGTYEPHKMEDEKVVVTLHGDRVSGKYALFSMRGSRDWLIHRMDPPADDTRVAVPIGVIPMQATTGPLPEDEGWVYEPRWHGIRSTVTDDTGRVVILDAAGENVSMKFPEIRRIGRALGHLEVILDGHAITAQPWELRRRRLDDLRLDGPGWRTSPTMTLEETFELATGVVAKRRDAVYRIGTTPPGPRSPDWIDAVVE